MNNLLDPAILLFFLGLFAGAVRSNLEVPPPIAKFLSLYLLMAIGFKGGVSLAASGISVQMLLALSAALLLALAVPAYAFLVLRRRLGEYDAAAVAATYGSVSAVTYITATAFLDRQPLAYDGYMTVALVLMESPAIVMALVLANFVRRHQSGGPAAAPVSTGHVLREAFTDGAHLLLLGSLAIGALTGEKGRIVLDPFVSQIFKGMLGFFLLDMGLVVARRARELKSQGAFLTAFGVLAPMFNAAAAIGLALLLGRSAGNALLLAVLAASASYIVVPAVVRYAIPEANPSLYFGMALVITFPFNIVAGIPLYFAVIQRIWS